MGYPISKKHETLGLFVKQKEAVICRYYQRKVSCLHSATTFSVNFRKIYFLFHLVLVISMNEINLKPLPPDNLTDIPKVNMLMSENIRQKEPKVIGLFGCILFITIINHDTW